MPERDLFANFERMRREVDELFGGVFERTGLSRRRGGFSPAVDVAYLANPPRAIVTGPTLPDRAPVLPLREMVAFPDMVMPLNIGQERSIELINDALRGDRSIVMVSSRNAEVESPGPDDLYSVGVLGVVARMIR